MIEQRMNLFKSEPAAYEAIVGLEKYLAKTDIDQTLNELIKIRASQINGCAFCLHMHTRDAIKNGETQQRIFGLDAWRDSPLYTEKERTALALTECVTRISESGVPDDVYHNAREHFGEKLLGQMIVAIATINVWNRIAIATLMPPED